MGFPFVKSMGGRVAILHIPEITVYFFGREKKKTPVMIRILEFRP